MRSAQEICDDRDANIVIIGASDQSVSVHFSVGTEFEDAYAAIRDMYGMVVCEMCNRPVKEYEECICVTLC